jgi:WXG100 family type VII secretion target
MSNVDSEKIVSTVSQLDSLADAMTAQMRKIVEAVAALDRGWTGAAKAEFISRYKTDEAAMQEMVEQYAEISRGLKDIAADLDKTESDIESSVHALG